jgi:hypothetical protein
VAEQVGQILTKVQSILDHNKAQLDASFVEFGSDPAECRAFLTELDDNRKRLEHVVGLVGSTFDTSRLTSYAETQGALQTLRDYVAEVLAQGQGSVANTRHALDLLEVAQGALARLMALLGVTVGQDEAGSRASTVSSKDLIERLSKYQKDDLFKLAGYLNIKRDDLDGTSELSLARTLVERAAEIEGQYDDLLKMVSSQPP